MSGFNDGSDDFLTGYKKPPVAHRFKKGQSGNAKGRPRKIARTVLPDQLTRDILAIANMPVRIKSKGRELEVSSYEAVMMKLRALALNGQISSIKEFVRLSHLATADFAEKNERNMELYKMMNERVRSKLGNPPQALADHLNRMSRAIKKTLK